MAEHLYEMTGDLLEFQQLVTTEDIPPEAVADTIEALEMSFNDKAIAVIKVAQGMDGETAAIETEINRLQARLKTKKARADSMREYLRRNMEITGINKIECPLFTITLAKAAKALEITDSDAIPDRFMRVKTVIEVDKKPLTDALKEEEAALEALKDNHQALSEYERIPGAKLVDGKRSLRIK